MGALGVADHLGADIFRQQVDLVPDLDDRYLLGGDAQIAEDLQHILSLCGVVGIGDEGPTHTPS